MQILLEKNHEKERQKRTGHTLKKKKKFIPLNLIHMTAFLLLLQIYFFQSQIEMTASSLTLLPHPMTQVKKFDNVR